MNHDELQKFKIELSGTAEAMGKEISDLGLRVFAEDLEAHNFHDAVEALRDCRRSLNRFPTINDLIAKIESKDGRPGAEEAWALIPKDESGSVVWTNEMSVAYGIAAPLLSTGDEIAARMAFKEKYAALVKESRENKTPVRWVFSGGTDASNRASTIQLALSSGRISDSVAAALGHETTPKYALPAPTPQASSPEEVRAKVKALIAQITKPIPGVKDEA